MKGKYAYLILLSTLLFACGGGETNSDTVSSSENISENTFSSEDLGQSLNETSSALSNESSSEIKTLEIFKAALDNQDKISSGTLTYSDGYNEIITNFEFGVDQYGDFVHTSERSGSYTTTTYYGYNKTKEIYSLEYGDDYIRSSSEVLTGEEIYGPGINPYSDEKLFGTFGIATSLFDLAINDANWDYMNLSTSEEYKFSVGKVIDGLQPVLWVNTVTFVVESDVLKSLEVKFEKYIEISADYEFNNVYYINDNAAVKQTNNVLIEQVIGEKTAINPYDIESFYYESFDLKDSDGNIVGETITMDAGLDKELTIENYLPSSANPLIDQINVMDSTGFVSGSYSYITNKVSINCIEVGEYNITISSKKVSKSFKLVVELPAPENISILYYIQSGSDFNAGVLDSKGGSLVTYVDSELYVRGSFSPYTADQSYTFEVVGTNADDVSWEKTKIKTSSWVDNYQEVYKISSSEVGIYRFKIASVKKPTLYKLVKFEVLETPSLDNLLAERYITQSDGMIYTDISFVPNEYDCTQGKVSVSDVNNSNITGTYNYIYDESTRKFNLIKLNGLGQELTTAVELSLEFNGNYDLVYSTSKSVFVLSVFSYEFMLSKVEWQGRDSNGGWSMFEFNIDGTGQFSYSRTDSNFKPVESFSCNITYSVKNVDGVIIITLDDDSKTLIEDGGIVSSISTITTDENFRSLSVTLSVHGVEQTLSLVRGN